jgi:aminoglycoside 6'-N-acetyltransferase
VPDAPTLQGERVTLRPIRTADAPALVSILTEPEVARWWGMQPPHQAADELVADDEAVVCAIEVEGDLVGCIQYYEEEDPDYRHAGMDIFLATAAQDRGLGSEALRLLGRYLVDQRGHHRLVIDPRADNERAIRAYERVGFRRVGLMRRYERGSDGEWHDGLLMDLLAGELVDR